MATARVLTFATLLRRHRKEAGLSQEALAERAGLSRRGVSDLERDSGRTPRKDTAALLADALGLGEAERALFLAAALRHGSPGAADIPPPSGAPSALATTVSPPLVGRVQELGLLDRLLRGEGPPMLLLAGEPGIGKTRLLREATTQAQALGWTALEGGCHRRSGQEPYAPLVGTLHAHVRRLSRTRLRGALEGCSWLVRLLPELAETAVVPLPTWSIPAEQERRLLFDAVARYLTNVAGRAGTLLVLDDLQWAGPDALDLLALLARAAEVLPLRFVGAYRSTEIQPTDDLATMIGDLASAGVAARSLLGPLAASEAAELLTALLRDAGGQARGMEERMLRRADGVPFFLVSCAQALGQRGDADPDANGGDDLPWTVAQSIRQRVAALPRAAQDLLALAAVAGRQASRSLLIGVSGAERRGAEEVVAALDAACQAHLLVEVGADACAFSHDLIREVLAGDLSATRRSYLHLRIAEAYERQSAEPPSELLAYHYARGGAREKAAEYLRRAGQMAEAVFAFAEAEHAYRTAAALAEQLGDLAGQAEAWARLGNVFNLLGKRADARDAFEAALAMYQELGDTESVWRTMARLTLVRRYQGAFPAEGLERLQPLLEDMETAEASAALAELYNVRGILQSDRRQDDEAVADHWRAAEIAEAVGDLGLRARARFWLGRALKRAKRNEEASQIWEATIAAFEAVDDLPGLCWLLKNNSEIYLMRGDFTGMRRFIERATTLAEQVQSPWHLAITLDAVGALAFYCGEWTRARLSLERAVSCGRKAGEESEGLRRATCRLGQLLLVTGREEAGAMLLDEAASNYQVLHGEARGSLAERDLLVGRPGDARARLAELPTTDSSGWPIALTGMPWLALADQELGHGGEATEGLAQHIELVASQGDFLALMDALRVRAQLEIRQGRLPDAQATLEETLARCRAMPYPYAEAKALWVYGQLEAARGNPEAARERYEAALAILNRLGERMYAEVIERALEGARIERAR